MTVFKRYFVYQLKQSALRTLVFTVLTTMICMSITNGYISPPQDIHKSTGIEILATFLGIFCCLIPILELSGFKNRRNLDTLYFFPIKRERMALAHYLAGVCQVFVIYTVSFIAVWLTLAIKTSCFSLEYMPLYYICSLVAGAVLYSIVCFIFSEANSVADGVVFVALWFFAVYIVMFCLRAYVLRAFLAGTEFWTDTVSLSEWWVMYAPINNLTVIFQDLIETNQQSYPYDYTATYAERYLSQAYMFAVWVLAGAFAAFGFFRNFKRKGAHMAGEVSNSICGYKLLIPLYGYALLLMYSDLDIMTILIFAMMLIGYFIYRRGFKIKKSDIIFIVCGIIPVILSAILNNLEYMKIY